MPRDSKQLSQDHVLHMQTNQLKATPSPPTTCFTELPHTKMGLLSSQSQIPGNQGQSLVPEPTEIIQLSHPTTAYHALSCLTTVKAVGYAFPSPPLPHE